MAYASGASGLPLIGDTISAHFDKAAQRWADRDALIVRRQNNRWSYGELKAKVDTLPAGLLALWLVPAHHVDRRARHPEFKRFDLSSLRGSPCPIEVMKCCVSEMNTREVTIAYGMTKTSPVSTQTACDDPLEHRVGTVGRVHPHVEIKIVDTDGRIVPPSTAGELCTRGLGR
jgi:acyl-CoA synthetase (AMP-forming)/AMP-acid ligase II